MPGIVNNKSNHNNKHYGNNKLPLRVTTGIFVEWCCMDISLGLYYSGHGLNCRPFYFHATLSCNFCTVLHFHTTCLHKCLCHSLVKLSAVTHAPFHASVLRPASQVGPMHKNASVIKQYNLVPVLDRQ